jgi:two-component system, response regulator YesN
LRAKKNLSFSSNTMNRMAAAKGGVEPQYLHAISEKFALKIEAAVAMSDLDAINFSMIEEYCDAVKNFAVNGYSSVVRKALMYINIHFKETINVQSVAAEIGFNRAYLAKKFKKELNISVIDYIHKKRIEEAIFLMEQGHLSITDIGIQVGFSSYNYFCKVFKEIKGMTATEYKGSKPLEKKEHD